MKTDYELLAEQYDKALKEIQQLQELRDRQHDLIDKQREALEEFFVAWYSDRWALRKDAIVKKVREALDLK